MKLRRLPVLAAVLFVAATTFAQTAPGPVDVLYLKDGSIIRGQILEMNAEGNIRIRTADGSVYVYAIGEVDRMVKEAPPGATVPPSTPQQTQVASAESPAPSALLGGVCISGGIALPVGKFAETEVTVESAGLATIGFTGALDAAFPVMPALGVIVSGVYCYNGVEKPSLPFGIAATVETGAWHSLWGLGGLLAGAALDPSWQIAVFGQAGVLYGMTPEISVSSGMITIRQESASAASFAWSVGAQVRYTRVVLTGRYLAGEPEYEAKITGVESNPTITFEQPMSIVTITLGFVL